MVEFKRNSLEDYRVMGSVKDIAPIELKQYCSFLDVTYKDNGSASEYLLVKHPRWSIIAGYYAMHDISKLFLAKKYNLRFSQPSVHAAVIQALRELVKQKDIIHLIEEAEETYEEITSLHLALMRGKEEREKSQYYNAITSSPDVNARKSAYFLDKVVKPYLAIVEKLIDEAEQK